MPDNALFLFGVLSHLPLLKLVSGCDLAVQGADLGGQTLVHAVSKDGQRQDFPVLVPCTGAAVHGILVRPNSLARERLAAYEQVLGCDAVTMTVSTDNGSVDATVYLPPADLWHGGEAWDLGRWVTDQGALSCEVAGEVMALLEVTSPEAVRERLYMLQIRAASRRRAVAEPAPATLRRSMDATDVQVAALRRPYTFFFGVEEADVQFRRFDGSYSPTVTRAGFIMGDAVTVLPYDPVRDAVMLVEQFRYGPYARGDRNPWSLEPIAGRIDPLETPEAAARRESVEEARLSMGAMHVAGRYYVSPGAVTEYLVSYIGIADLPDTAEGVNGLEIEAEDIRAHVISFDRLMAMVDSGEAENGPLLISAQWLALNRARLRTSA